MLYNKATEVVHLASVQRFVFVSVLYTDDRKGEIYTC